MYILLASELSFYRVRLHTFPYNTRHECSLSTTEYAENFSAEWRASVNGMKKGPRADDEDQRVGVGFRRWTSSQEGGKTHEREKERDDWWGLGSHMPAALQERGRGRLHKRVPGASARARAG